MPESRAGDVVIYIYQDDAPPIRGQRLAECANSYARWRALPAGDFTVELAPGGKPYFPHSPNIHFSLSHSGEYWAAAFGAVPLGLDIQRRVERDYLRIAKRWYRPAEYAAAEQGGRDCFFDIWSAKESLVKCSGEGFAAFRTCCVVENGKIAPGHGGRQLQPLAIAAGYSACLCGEKLGRIFIEKVN